VTEFCQVQNSLCVQVLRSHIGYWQRHCTALQQRASAKLCGVVKRAPPRPIFDRAAITLGIDPYSSYLYTMIRPFVACRPIHHADLRPKASDTLESFLSKVAFESDFQKKACTCVMKTFEIFLLSKETFTIRTCSILESFFRKLLSKATFERKLSSVSLPLRRCARMESLGPYNSNV